MSATHVMRTGMVFRATHPRVGLYWNFLRFTLWIDGAQPTDMQWRTDTFVPMAPGRHQLSVVGRPITRVGPTRANAEISVEVSPDEVVWVRYRGPVFALAFLGRLPLCRARLSVTKRARATGPRLPGVESSIEELDNRG
jgi:hypothetical protein